MQTLRLLQVLHIHTREGPLGRERAHLLAQRLDLLVADLALLLLRRDADEVDELLRAGLLLKSERDLHRAVQELGDDLDVLLCHVARGERGRAETDATGRLRRGVTVDSVLWRWVSDSEECRRGRIRTVDGDPHKIADLLDLATGEAEVAQVPEDKVVVGAIGLKLVAVGDERLSERASVLDDLLRVLLELRLRRLKKGSRNTSDGLRPMS